MRNRMLNFMVGCFMLAGFVALMVLSYKVSSLSQYSQGESYTIWANFDNVGDLKVRAPVTIAGVRIGEVAKITLNPQTYTAKVGIRISKSQQMIPNDSSASILTAGLLGANYIAITPGTGEKKEDMLKGGSKIEETNPAIILEDLIGKLLFNVED